MNSHAKYTSRLVGTTVTLRICWRRPRCFIVSSPLAHRSDEQPNSRAGRQRRQQRPGRSRGAARAADHGRTRLPERQGKALDDFQGEHLSRANQTTCDTCSPPPTRTALDAALQAAMGGVPDPVFLWVAGTPRTWHGYTFPGTRWFATTPTRSTGLRASTTPQATRSRIQIGKHLPSQLSFLTYDNMMLERGDDNPLSSIEIRDETLRNADGSITLIAAPGPANGRANFLELKPGACRSSFARSEGLRRSSRHAWRSSAPAARPQAASRWTSW